MQEETAGRPKLRPLHLGPWPHKVDVQEIQGGQAVHAMQAIRLIREVSSLGPWPHKQDVQETLHQSCPSTLKVPMILGPWPYQEDMQEKRGLPIGKHIMVTLFIFIKIIT